MKKEAVLIFILSSLLVSAVFAQTETPTGTFEVGNVAPPAPTGWSPFTTHNKSQVFTWVEGTDDNDDAISTYICISADTDNDSCNVVDFGLTADPNYAFTQAESNWDYSWGAASRDYYVKLTPNDGTDNGTVNDSISFTLTNAIPTITGATSDASVDGNKNVGETITFSMTSHGDTDASDTHNLRVCKTNSINTSGECTGGEYCNEHNNTYSTDADLACTYTAQQGDSTNNTAYFFVCDCPADDNDCPGQCSAAASHTFYVNYAPSASSVEVIPDGATSAQDLTCNYSFTDADGDSEGSSTFRWFKGGVEEPGETSAILSSSNTAEGEDWKCEVTPKDEHGLAGDPVNSSSENIQNAAPDQPTEFKIQDGAASWDSSTNPDTHDLTPNINWTAFDNDGDTVTTYVCIATNASNRDSNNCNVNYTTTTTDYIESVSGLAYSGTSRTYYIRLTPNDGQKNGTALDANFTLINSIPNIPSDLSPGTTHDQTPDLSWTATDDDDGSVDHWPADSLTYYLRVGTGYGDGTYENNNNANKAGESVDNPIPWGTSEETYANNTVYVSIWTGDGNGANSSYYNTTLILYDFLPDITNVEMADAGGVYSSCTAATCALNPVEHSNATVAARVTINDTDDDCDSSGNVYLSLCLNTSSCSPAIQDYGWELDSVSRTGSICTFTFSVNKTASDSTPEFFRAPSSNYKWYVNATSQAGARTIDSERTDSWTYGTLKAVDYPSTVTLGDGSPVLGQWNNGTSLAVMTNWGNDNLHLQWNATDPTSGTDTWILNGTDFQIDDDNKHGSETEGSIAPVYMDGTKRTFEPSSGLEVCSSAGCDNPSLNETLNTYYHIRPPIGLAAGTYNSTISITIS